MSESCGSCHFLAVIGGGAPEPNALYACAFPLPPLPIALLRQRARARDGRRGLSLLGDQQAQALARDHGLAR